MTSYPKSTPLRDEAYRRLVAALPCAWCGMHCQSQAAHRNQGKGMSLKTSDAEIFPLCGPAGLNCHALLDSGGRFSKPERREQEDLWVRQTQRKLRAIARSDESVRKIVEKAIGL